MASATQTSLGEIKLAGDIAGSNNALLPELTTVLSTPGVFTLPTLTVDTKGRITAISSGSTSSLASLLPVATASVLGCIKVGSNLTIGGASSDTLSVPVASSTTKGVASFSSDFTVVNGAVSLNTISSLPIATPSTLGVIKAGSGTSIAGDGTLSIPYATASVAGVVMVGSGLTVSGGVISLASTPAVATNSTVGLVKPANTSNLTVGAGGAIDVGSNIPQKNTANTYTKAQVVAAVTPTFSATQTLDFSLSNVFNINPTSNFTLANPTNVVAGGNYIVIVKQDATGGRAITWGSNFKFASGAATTISSTANSISIISIVAKSTTELLVSLQVGF